MAAEGMINQNGLHNFEDSIYVYLRNSFSPYSIVDSAKGVIKANTLTGNFSMKNVNSGSYYISVKSGNLLETWSKNPVQVIKYQTFNYNFTTSASQAYGNNLILKNDKYCIYSGDIDKNRIIELSDVLDIFNDVNNFTSGYENSDLNGDGIVDLQDINVATNNANIFIRSKHP